MNFRIDYGSRQNGPVTDIADPTTSAPPAGLDEIMGGRAHTIGSFQFRFADQSWEWSDEVAQLHGVGGAFAQLVLLSLGGQQLRQPDGDLHTAVVGAGA